MGLDMFAWKVKQEDALDTFEISDAAMGESGFREELYYWRKHHDLHGWMFQLAKKKGFEGEGGDFNCVPVRLTLEDLNALEADIRSRALPATTGFFFGNYPPDDDSDTEDFIFITRAREAINEGYAVYYDSWW